jgi:hypothetical protein
MLFEPLKFDSTLKLTPFSGVQFLEYALNSDQAGRLSRRFVERELPSSAWIDGKPTLQLFPAWDENDPTSGVEQSAGDSDREYSISERAALDPFLNKWVPVPYFRMKASAAGGEELDAGPTNWARMRITEASNDSGERQASHFVVFAFDTDLLDRKPNRPYTAPSSEDAANEHEFRFAYRFNEIAWFLGTTSTLADSTPAYQEWVPAWLQEIFREYKQAQRPERPLRDTDFPNALEHYARYLVLLEYLHKAISPRSLRLIDTVTKSPAAKPVLVDMVVDVGNSRTCGILIESHPNEDRIDLNNSLVLQLRDLSEPEKLYTEPFESHVELSSANFGRENLSRLSSRARAFFWPSPVRVGPEASRFRDLAEGTEALGGLSSPKRYLCDTRAVSQEWRFPERDYTIHNTAPLIERAIRQFVNAKGDVILQLDQDRKKFGFIVRSEDRLGASRMTFSRSSFFTFLISEVICQALSMINSIGVRHRRQTKDAPRRLRRIILTLPPAMPVQEQRLLRSRAEGAVKLVWQLMGWWDNRPVGAPAPPEVQVSWDEASCVQFVYLYGQIAQKLGGSVDGLFSLVGKKRPPAEADGSLIANAAPEPSVRIASIDVGGGTTDLMITTYFSEGNRAIKPVQNFREGFRIAGDDLLKGVIEQLVLPPIEEALKEAGLLDPRGFLLERFGGNRANMAEQEKHLRRQFVLRVLEPIALKLLSDAEIPDFSREARHFEEFFPFGGRDKSRLLPSRRIVDFLEAPVRAAGISSFSLASCRFVSDPPAIEGLVSSILDGVFNNLAEAIHEFDCDVVLLSGRPSCLPNVVDLFANKLAVSPDKIVPLHRYQAGNWYPFRAADNRRIGDPKTTTAVGGMLCALAENQLTNFTLYTGRLGLRSTARYIGELELDGRLMNSKVYFSEVDFDSPTAAKDQTAEITYYAPMRLGYRQLPLERWIANPLYRLRLRAGADVNSAQGPFKVRIDRLGDQAIDEDSPDALLRSESAKEEFAISEAVDANGENMTNKFELVLDTLSSEQGYWLDTGILKV